jgi:hypothetical protein
MCIGFSPKTRQQQKDLASQNKPPLFPNLNALPKCVGQKHLAFKVKWQTFVLTFGIHYMWIESCLQSNKDFKDQKLPIANFEV